MTDHPGAISPTRLFAPLAIILGIPLIFAAVYFYTNPIVLETGGQQGIFKCGSPSDPNTDAKNVCQLPESSAEKRAIYSGLSGVALGGLGAFWMFRGVGRQDEDADLDDDSDDRMSRSSRTRSGAGASRDEFDRDEDAPPTRRSRREQREAREAREAREREADADSDEDADEDEAPARRSRASLKDDDFDVPSRRSRRRDSDEDDWSSDGWR